MADGRFDLADFNARVEAKPRERSVLRQALIRGLKDFSESVYGYDRFGAEAIIHLSDRMSEPYILGFGILRILHSRRLAEQVKVSSALTAIDAITYGTETGVPYGLLEITQFLFLRCRLSPADLRYVLVASAGQYNPFHGSSKASRLEFAKEFFACAEFSGDERAFWSHSLISRHQDLPGAGDLIQTLMSEESVPMAVRSELSRAWINFRQPNLNVAIPAADSNARSRFVAEHMHFWVAHSPSWPSHHMVRLGLIWLARFGEQPAELAHYYIAYRETYADQFHAAVADIISEHRDAIAEEDLRTLVDLGVRISASTTTRRRFYRLGASLFGSAYLGRATEDSAESIRRWASEVEETFAP